MLLKKQEISYQLKQNLLKNNNMKNKELLEKTEKELEILLNEKKKKIEDARFKAVTSGIKNVREIRENRKDIARILTIISKK